MRLTQRGLAVDSLDVHESGQAGAHGDGVLSGGLVGPLNTAALPVRPVEVGAQQGEAVRVLHRGHQRATVLSVQVRSLDALRNTRARSHDWVT